MQFERGCTKKNPRELSLEFNLIIESTCACLCVQSHGELSVSSLNRPRIFRNLHRRIKSYWIMRYHVIPLDRSGSPLPSRSRLRLHKWSVKWTRCTWSVWECFGRKGIRKPKCLGLASIARGILHVYGCAEQK